MLQAEQDQNYNYSFHFAAASFLMAETDAATEVGLLESKDRQVKKKKVVSRKFALMLETYKTQCKGITKPMQLREVLKKWDATINERTTMLIDLSFSNPYSPYELKISDKGLNASLHRVGKYIKLNKKQIDNIIKSKEDAISVHKQVDYKKILLLSIGGAILLGPLAWIAAPAIGGALGAGAGLAGAGSNFSWPCVAWWWKSCLGWRRNGWWNVGSDWCGSCTWIEWSRRRCFVLSTRGCCSKSRAIENFKLISRSSFLNDPSQEVKVQMVISKLEMEREFLKRI